METDTGSEILYSENQTMDIILILSNTKPSSGSNDWLKQQTIDILLHIQTNSREHTFQFTSLSSCPI